MQGEYTATKYLRGTLHDAHHLSSLFVLDDGNGVLVNWVKRDELRALVVVPQSVLVLITILKHLQRSKQRFSVKNNLANGKPHLDATHYNSMLQPLQ